jgi:hypothetical protein
MHEGRKSISKSVSVPRHDNTCSSNSRATYVDPDASFTLIVLKNLVLEAPDNIRLPRCAD